MCFINKFLFDLLSLSSNFTGFHVLPPCIHTGCVNSCLSEVSISKFSYLPHPFLWEPGTPVFAFLKYFSLILSVADCIHTVIKIFKIWQYFNLCVPETVYSKWMGFFSTISYSCNSHVFSVLNKSIMVALLPSSFNCLCLCVFSWHQKP